MMFRRLKTVPQNNTKPLYLNLQGQFLVEEVFDADKHACDRDQEYAA
jgi:hypothetical protein